jgi:hypothetical protein
MASKFFTADYLEACRSADGVLMQSIIAACEEAIAVDAALPADHATLVMVHFMVRYSCRLDRGAVPQAALDRA